MRNEDHDDLDRILDAALAAYAAKEPQAGMEHRVLARLPAPRQRTPWLRWAVPVPVLAGLLLIMGYWTKPEAPSGMAALPLPMNTAEARSEEPRRLVVQKAAGNRRTGRRRQPRIANPGTFPSPAVLTAEERAVVRLAMLHPEILRESQIWQERRNRPVTIEPINIRPLTIDMEGRTE